MELIDLTALMWLAESDPCATYLVEDVDGRRILWRLSEGEPCESAYAPLPLWPMLLPA